MRRRRSRITSGFRWWSTRLCAPTTPTPARGFKALLRISSLNDRYALDGRDPVSQSNFMWILGLHDRPFQERAIIGKVRPMSSDRTMKKFDLDRYLQRYGPQPSLFN